MPLHPLTPGALSTYNSFRTEGALHDGPTFLKNRLGKGENDAVQLFHRAKDAWETPGKRAWVSANKSDGLFGKGFYTSTVSEGHHGPYEFQLEIPVKAFEGKRVLEVCEDSLPPGFKMPENTDVLAVIPYFSEGVWFVFKPGSEDWLNKSATVADFDAPGEPYGWS